MKCNDGFKLSKEINRPELYACDNDLKYIAQILRS